MAEGQGVSGKGDGADGAGVVVVDGGFGGVGVVWRGGGGGAFYGEVFGEGLDGRAGEEGDEDFLPEGDEEGGGAQAGGGGGAFLRAEEDVRAQDVAAGLAVADWVYAQREV